MDKNKLHVQSASTCHQSENQSSHDSTKRGCAYGVNTLVIFGNSQWPVAIGARPLSATATRWHLNQMVDMMTSSNGNIFRATGHVCRDFTGLRWNSPHKGQWRGALIYSLICVWINGCVNNRGAGDFRRYCAHYDISIMLRINLYHEHWIYMIWLYMNCYMSWCRRDVAPVR